MTNFAGVTITFDVENTPQGQDIVASISGYGSLIASGFDIPRNPDRDIVVMTDRTAYEQLTGNDTTGLAGQMSTKIAGQYTIFVDPTPVPPGQIRATPGQIAVHEVTHITHPGIGRGQPHQTEFYVQQELILSELGIGPYTYQSVAGAGLYPGGNQLEQAIARYGVTATQVEILSQLYGAEALSRLSQSLTVLYGEDFGLSATYEGVTGGALVSPECFGPDTPIDMWPLDPVFAPDPSNPNKVFDQDAVRAKIWKKPIAMIRKGDVVVSFDKNDNLMPGRVTRTFENESKILLDYFGTRVTAGHVYFRPDSKKADKFECLLDILRDDGMIQNVEGKNIRAATNVPVGDPRDGFVWAVIQERKNGILVEKERGRIRLGTRFIIDGKTSQCVADVIAARGGTIGDDELIRFGDSPPMPFAWEHGATLPKPEDFVLQASGTTLTDIYKAGEWESRRPHMPAPMVMDGGLVQPLSATRISAMSRNQPLSLQSAADASAPKGATRSPMNRKQRKAMEAKQRKAAKVRIGAMG